ncbi:MAG: hypothetical protein ACK5QC_05480 [Bacteroidota bacterium]|jgi:hypothetical protein
MAFNLLKKYNQLLELNAYSLHQCQETLKKIFARDIEQNGNFHFRGKKINPVKGEPIPMQTLFTHLTTVIIDQKTRKREYEPRRSERLHWLKHHVEEKKQAGMLVFSCKDPDGIRTYILDEEEAYVIILAPYRDGTEYYLLTAYYLNGRNPEKIKKKYKRRLLEIH